jgi:hypothetical protein
MVRVSGAFFHRFRQSEKQTSFSSSPWPTTIEVDF